MENEAISNHEATATLPIESVWGIECANGRVGSENACVTASGPLEKANATAW